MNDKPDVDHKITFDETAKFVFAIIDFVFFRLHLCGGGALNATVLSSFHPVWRARPFREVVIVRRGALTFCGRPSRA